MRLHLGRAAAARVDRDAQGAVQGRIARAALGALIRARALAAAALPLVAVAPSLRAQADTGSALQLTAVAGALRVGDDFALGSDARWTPVAGARLGWRPFPAVTLGGEAWLGDESLRGVGVVATFRPWAERAWPVDPAFEFGIESVDNGDDEERGPGFVFGAGLERRTRRWAVDAAARHHFLTIDEAEVDGIATGRDAELWEVRAGVSLLLGGAP